MADSDAAKRIYQDKVDILVDLIGYTKGNRMAIFACRPAPIQVRYLGFPGTTGADFYDYFVTDKIATPQDHAPYYSECFAYLPDCYQINDNTQAVSNKTWKKSDFGLPEKCFIFCSFNHAYKIDPSIFNTWMEILETVPQSVLWLLKANDPAVQNLKQEASLRNIDPGRLIFSDPLPKSEHLARLRLADLALDTITVNGHITTSDAIWAGVPVITRTGRHFISRVSTSILTGIGLPELITSNYEGYKELATHLAQNPDQLALIRHKIETNRSTKPLFDTPRFTRNLEKAFIEMMKRHTSGNPPRQIIVAEH